MKIKYSMSQFGTFRINIPFIVLPDTTQSTDHPAFKRHRTCNPFLKQTNLMVHYWHGTLFHLTFSIIMQNSEACKIYLVLRTKLEGLSRMLWFNPSFMLVRQTVPVSPRSKQRHLISKGILNHVYTWKVTTNLSALPGEEYSIKQWVGLLIWSHRTSTTNALGMAINQYLVDPPEIVKK